MSTSKKSSAKSVKVTKKAVKAAAKPAKLVIGDNALATVYKVKKQFPNGVRADFTKAIPKSGAPLRAIAKKAGVEVRKARGYAYWLASNGFLTRVAA
jgi:hypothetical protein